jgi:hypothetical protein
MRHPQLNRAAGDYGITDGADHPKSSIATCTNGLARDSKCNKLDRRDVLARKWQRPSRLNQVECNTQRLIGLYCSLKSNLLQ